MKLSLCREMVSAIRSAGVLSAIALPLTWASIPSSMAQDINCANATNQQELSLCARQEFEASDRKLNQTYQQLLSQLTGQPRRLLISAQEAWIDYRNTTCIYRYEGYTRDLNASLKYSNCLNQLSERRIQDLQNYLQPR